MPLCLNCGKKLRPCVTERGLKMMLKRCDISAAAHPDQADYYEKRKREMREHHEPRLNTFGYDGRGFFCRGMCAQRFADVMARAGYRLKGVEWTGKR